jgi:DNA-binding response OmpR family regulator
MTDRIRVLYVDDEPSLLEIAKLFLEREGAFIVDTLPSAPEALKQLNTKRYDAILSDYQMPEMDGITFLKKLRATGNTTPFIIFTGRGREEVVIEALNNGADFYIQKGGEARSQFAELSNKIHYAVSRKQSEEALGVSEVLEKEMEYHEKELMKFYNQSLDTTNKKLILLSGITRNDILYQLTLLQSSTDILAKNLPDTSYAEYVKKIEMTTERIFSIIRFNQKYEDIGVNTPLWVNISEIVDCADRDKIVGHLRLVNDLPAGTEVFADALIANVFYSLMDNTARYSRNSTSIRFSVKESGDNQIIICENDGEGVPQEEKERIFDKGVGNAAGLGLAFSRDILDLNGISIHETGEPDKGGRFEITVPKVLFRSAPR